jgi:serine/threonine-protein kinase RsbT
VYQRGQFPDVADQITLRISSDIDIVAARQTSRDFASKLGFQGTDLVLVTTGVSELARNILVHARRGELQLSAVTNGPKRGLQIIARDQGPGIPDIGLALKDGFSTAGSLGLGLPGTRRIMDEFEIASAVKTGTTIRAVKWLRKTR